MKRARLSRKTPLRSRGRLRPVSRKRAAENRLRDKVKRALVAERGEMCEAHVEGICSGRAVDAHEVKTRGRGGSITDGRNILLVCRSCHDWIGAHPVAAAERGLIRWSWDTEGEALPPGGDAA